MDWQSAGNPAFSRSVALFPLFQRVCALLLAVFVLLYPAWSSAFQPIRPLPQQIAYHPIKAELGKRLFFDKRLSADGSISCASCHDPDHGGADPRPVSTGVYGRKGTINAPTVFNSYFNFRQFWNGRAGDLKEQAAGPIHNPLEMSMTESEVEKQVASDPVYLRLIEAAYGTRKVRFEQLMDAIAEFEKALLTPDSKLDRYLRGETELSEEESEGYRLFKSLGCATCHNGINVGGNSYQYLGAVIPSDIEPQGGDRYSLTKKPFDKNRFKVPSLRNIALTAPYLHDGSQKDLNEQVLLMGYHNLGFRLEADEIRVLVAFLNTLTGKHPAILGGP